MVLVQTKEVSLKQVVFSSQSNYVIWKTFITFLKPKNLLTNCFNNHGCGNEEMMKDIKECWTE